MASSDLIVTVTETDDHIIIRGMVVNGLNVTIIEKTNPDKIEDIGTAINDMSTLQFAAAQPVTPP